MSKNKFLLLIFLTVFTIFSLSSCILFNLPQNDKGNVELNSETAYQMAKDAGYTGTFEEFVSAIKGADGKDGADG